MWIHNWYNVSKAQTHSHGNWKVIFIEDQPDELVNCKLIHHTISVQIGISLKAESCMRMLQCSVLFFFIGRRPSNRAKCYQESPSKNTRYPLIDKMLEIKYCQNLLYSFANLELFVFQVCILNSFLNLIVLNWFRYHFNTKTILERITYVIKHLISNFIY